LNLNLFVNETKLTTARGVKGPLGQTKF